MNKIILYGTGFLAQLFFSARMLIQWIGSEKEGRVLSPSIFWIFSITGALLLLIYGILRKDIVITVSQSILFPIYLRNLHLKKILSIPAVFLRWSMYLTLTGILSILFFQPDIAKGMLPTADSRAIVWIFVGGTGQLLFILRFVYQWFYSEKRGISMLPAGFWMISISGTILITAYAVFRKDPVLFIGQIFSIVVYTRNIQLCFRNNG